MGTSEIGVTGNISRSWDASVAGQLLFNQNLKELWIASADVGLGFQYNQHLKIEVHYREIRFRNLDNHYENRTLFYNTITIYESAGKLSFSLRNRLQQLVYGDHFNDSFRGPLWYNRDKLTVKYRVDYFWAPYISVETFVPVNHTSRHGIDQIRMGLGVQYTFCDHLRSDVSWKVMQQFQRTGNDRFYALAVNLYYKFGK